jgi:hypothetical protein
VVIPNDCDHVYAFRVITVTSIGGAVISAGWRNGVRFPAGARDLSLTASRPALDPTRPPNQ